MNICNILDGVSTFLGFRARRVNDAHCSGKVSVKSRLCQDPLTPTTLSKFETLVRSQWFSNVLSNQALVTALPAQAWFHRKFKNH